MKMQIKASLRDDGSSYVKNKKSSFLTKRIHWRLLRPTNQEKPRGPYFSEFALF